jgi:replicative DNA helicase
MIAQDYLEKLILKFMLQDQNYLVTIISTFKKEYFDNRDIGATVEQINEHYNKYHNIPPESNINNSLLDDINSIDFDFVKHYDYFLDETNKHLKNQAIKQAILDSVDIINSGENITTIRDIVESALCKDLRIDIGLNYFDTLGERLKRILSGSHVRIPTYFTQLDEYLAGGFPPYTLSTFGAAIHGGKSQLLCNMAARQVLNGHNVVLLTLEMSEDAFAQRFDALFANKDINRIYTIKEVTTHLIKKLKEIKDTQGLGTLFIKQFPAGTISVQEFRIYLRELTIRQIQPSIIMVDYLQLMKPSAKILDGTMYSRGKKIAEEMRGLSFEFKLPVVTLSQVNTQSAKQKNMNDITLYALQESSAIPATSDCVILLGNDEDSSVYENEIYYKIVKNRLGGRVGNVDKFYHDSRSLKMYDSTELDLWIEDAKESEDKRNIKER